MIKNIPIDDELIKDFVKEEFPNAPKPCIQEHYWFVHASKTLEWMVHYEYNEGKVHLDIEGNGWDWKSFRDYLKCEVLDSRVTSYRFGRNDCRWTLNKNPASWDEVKDAFRTIHSIFNYHIITYENKKYNDDLHHDNSNRVKAHFSSVSSILSIPLTIPEYQRPYRWSEKNVEQLLNDIQIARSNGKQEYVIGSIILHDNQAKKTFDIVDGQQRLTSIILIAKILKPGLKTPELKYDHSDSFFHIKENYRFINHWVESNLPQHDRENFINYLLESCHVVEIIVKELSEAFQLFETQNGRGKELEAYNLLKAYHIRAMSEASKHEKIVCDIRWEDSAMFVSRENRRIDLLRQLINEHLFRTRRWSRNDDAWEFNKTEVDEFKGLILNRDTSLDFTYQNILLQQQVALGFMKSMNHSLFKVKSRFEHGDPDNINPFASINQLILSGHSFFDYIETYVEIYKRLFIQLETSQLAEFKKFYKEQCLYNGRLRSGDNYIRQVYKSAIILTFDRFGERGVLYIYKELYICLYSYRLSMSQVRYNSMAKKERSGWIFSTIQNAKTLFDLNDIRQQAHELRGKAIKDLKFKNADIIKQYFDNYGK